MKVLFLNNTMQCGGAERVTANLANHWVRENEIAIATFVGTEGDFYELDERVERIDLGIPGTPKGVLRRLVANFERLRAVRRLLKARQPDIVVGVMTIPSILAVVGAIGLHSKVIVTEHNHPPMLRVSLFWSWLRWLTFRHAAAVVALTGETAAWLQQHCGCENVNVIPNPVAIFTSAAKPVLRPECMLPNDTRLLLAVGRLTYQKGFDLLIEAFARIRTQVPDWRLVIIGEGEQRAELERRVAENELETAAFLPGRAGNIVDWYHRADLYVLSSRFEGFSLTLAEAMAQGCPAVSYDCDVGPRDIIRDGVDGRLVRPVAGVVELADELLYVMTADVERKRMAEAATDVAVRYSPAYISTLWDNLFNRMKLNYR
jgi:glycosyltransferase involved in cell wall biosynthesis